jgi:hypothetical protein
LQAGPEGRHRLWLIISLWAVSVFAIEVATGPHFTFEPFYVPVVIMAGWRGGHFVASATSLACAVLGVLAEHLLSQPLFALAGPIEHPATPYWNGTAHLVMYLIVGFSISALHAALSERQQLVEDLQEAARRIRTLQGLLPVCAWCQRIRDARAAERWLRLEQYVAEHTDAQVTHGICPSCMHASGMAPANRTPLP